jgi:hypothetical protein
MTNFITAFDGLLGIPGLISGGFGIGLILFATVKIRQGHFFLGGLHSLIALCLISIAAVLLMLGLNFHTYQRLTFEEQIAEISFLQSGPQEFLTDISTSEYSPEQSYRLLGDEWQIDARVLKFTTPAILAGLDSRYRLERLSGRYSDITQENNEQRSVFDLSPEPGLAILPLLAKLNCCIHWIDTYYGNSVYMPMADQA